MSRSWRPPHATLLSVLVLFACGTDSPAPVLDLPPRPADAPGGDAIARAIRALDLDAREERIFDEIVTGNVPSWLRRLRRVDITDEVDGREQRLTFWATPDYLAVGSDADHLLVPLSLATARRIAEHVGASLPTPPMVDAIWRSADVRLIPIRLRLDEEMTTVQYFERHNSLLTGQRIVHDAPPGTFVAGHKLDVVRVPGPAASQLKVALYGWHHPDGRIIQPLFTDTTASWVIFSHGVRLVDRSVLVADERRDLLDVMEDRRLAPLLVGEG